MRKALLVGIDHYLHFTRLNGCVADARAVSTVMGSHADGRVNFANPRLLKATSPAETVDRGTLRAAVRELFSGKTDISLFYFAGHGHMEDVGGYLCTSDCRSGDEGLALAEVISWARAASATNKIIILDTCHGGMAGNPPGVAGAAELGEGMTILTASTADQYAKEEEGSGVFTNLLVDALQGAAANLVGDITPGSVYAHIDQSLGPWSQRPVFKTNVSSFVSLRQVVAPVPLDELKAIAEHFPTRDFLYQLDPSFEPERSREQREDPSIPPPNPEHNAIFEVLQKYAKVNLIKPVGEQHMYHAAMKYKSCKLTTLGEHYRRLVADHLL